MKKLLTLFVCSAWSLSSTAQVPAALQLKFQDTLQAMQLKYNYKGLSAAVSFKNTGIWKSAVGISTAGVPLNPDMLIGIGSNTKTFVSSMMVKLHEDGLVNLADTIGKWLHGYTNINGAITIRQILNHTSGINSYTDNAATWDSVNKDLKRIWTKEEILRKFVDVPSFAPGASWEYSNTNFIIAGLIEEKITGRPIYQLLRDSILTPNHLSHTFFPPYETATDPYAHIWSDWNGDGILDDLGEYSTSTIFPKEMNSLPDAAGALVSTAEDNVKFWKALMGGKIISNSSIQNDLLKWSGFGSSSSEYGLGIFKARYFGNIVFSHGGTWIGQINENLADTFYNIYITVLSNQDSLENDEVSKVVAALYKVALDYQKLGIDESTLPQSKVSIHPNPANDILTVDCDLNGEKMVRIYDLMGRIMYSRSLNSAEHSVILPVDNLTNGSYLVEIKGTEESVTEKIQILR